MKKIILSLVTLSFTYILYSQNPITTSSINVTGRDLYDAGVSLNMNSGDYNVIRVRESGYNMHAIHFFSNTWQNGNSSLSSGAINLSPGHSITFGLWDAPFAFFRQSDGFVGLGTTNPDEKLTVKGNIHAQEVKVDLQVPADYVFQHYYTGTSSLNKEYRFPSLQETEKFIKENHHLPQIPSAQQIQEQGLKVGEMTNLLLQKIEELTLYSIEQNKVLQEQEKQVNSFTQKNKELEDQLKLQQAELDLLKQSFKNLISDSSQH